jgi:preprotein translocase subunit SecD
VVLLIGILTSMFTAVLLSRLMIDWWVNRGKEYSFLYPDDERSLHQHSYRLD